ncbi:single-stranded DNA-binding protein [Rhodanobacter sp. 115]|uniref:single-stranded DNA-binding protein n=1 Tax=Rhodanobacter sp. FW021-MT20 TaxID=1162282 RepID=UPI0034E4FB58
MSASLFGSFRLGRDARMVEGQNGKFASLSLAYDTYDSSKGERVPQWIGATLNGTRAENLMEYLKKGTLVEAVIADPRLESYTKDGKETWQLQGHIIKIELLGGKREDDKPAEGGDAGGDGDRPL